LKKYENTWRNKKFNLEQKGEYEKMKGKEWERNERNDEDEAAGSKCWEDENDGVQQEQEEGWREWMEVGRKENITSERVQESGKESGKVWEQNG
jgi:hypothetical protein